MTFNRAKKTEPRVAVHRGERNDLTSVADLFTFSIGRSPLRKSGLHGGGLASPGPAAAAFKEDRLDWHTTLSQMRNLMSKAEKLDPASRTAEEAGRAAEEFMLRFRQVEGGDGEPQRVPALLGHPGPRFDRSFCGKEKAQRLPPVEPATEEGPPPIPQPQGDGEAECRPERPGSGWRTLRKSQSHSAVGRLLTGPEMRSQRRREQAASEMPVLGGDEADPASRLARSQTDDFDTQRVITRNASLPRLPRRQTCGF